MEMSGSDRKREGKFMDIIMPMSTNLRHNKVTSLEKVQPDLAFFDKNKYVINKRETKVAGRPDLIVEVWSDGNTEAHKDYKKYLYSTSPITEHWYIEQDSNKVKCYMGNEQLPDQYLTNILKTQNGIEFDLRYLAIR